MRTETTRRRLDANTEARPWENLRDGPPCPDKNKNAMKQTTTPACTRLARVLERLGYDREQPFVPDAPVPMMLVIDLPGVLDFAEPDATAFWTEKGTLWFASPGSPDSPVFDRYQDYGNGNYIDEHWNEEATDALAETLEATLPKA